MPGFTPLRTVLLRRALRSALAGCRSVLDVGCGDASALAATGFRGLAVGVDISAVALRDARRSGFHRALVQADAAALDRVFRPRSFDAVVALDVIEHLAREAALALVAALERTARQRVVVFTPNGFVAQPAAPDNPFQLHRSGFSARDMRMLGYRVRGIGGLRWVSGPFAEVRWRPRALWNRIADATAPLVYRAPDLAFALLCTKEVGAPTASQTRRA